MANTKHKTVAAKYKRKAVDEFTKLFDSYSIIGLVNMENLPAKQLQNMREQLRGSVLLRMTKKRLLKLAFEKSKKESIMKLAERMTGMPAIIFTNENPFKLFKILKKNQSKAPIKGGQKAPGNIVVPAGQTNFAPGPIIGELGAFKIKTGIENGKVAIKGDAVVAKQGDVVPAKLAAILQRLGIEPMTIGLDLVAVYQDGEIIGKDVLDVDEEAYLAKVRIAASESMALAVESGYACEESIKPMLEKAFRDAKALVLEKDIFADLLAKELLAKANAEASALKEKADAQ
ncbi:MAG: 50S ribosomal protein L10 [Candidatus Woesearchaeota archaeon]